MNKLFQSFAGTVNAHAMVNGSSVPAETPFLALGIFVPQNMSEPKFLIMLQGGTIATVALADIKVDLSDDMKKALAEVVLKS